MNAKAVLLALLPGIASAQGYGGLGATGEGFAEVTRPAELVFPRDHGPHPDFRIEWWYLTAALEGEDGRDYGVQWTLFRNALVPEDGGAGWSSPQFWMAHAGLTTEESHYHAEIFARGGIGQAGVELDPFRAWIDDWSLASLGGADPVEAVTLEGDGEGFAYRLEARAEGPLVRHGENGYSLKASEGQASYYYSQPFYSVAGVLEIEGEEVAVTGTGWLDREWSSQHMSPEQEGWDWFSLHLGDGHRLMAYRLREDGGGEAFGTWIAPDGTSRALRPGDVAMEPTGWAEVAGREVPVVWHLAVPALGVDVTTAAVNPQSWMGGSFPYWEGPIRVEGSHTGRGYLEMTGYE